MAKKLYDITFTVAMSEKQYKRLFDAEDHADKLEAMPPLRAAGLDTVDSLRIWYGVKARLKRWGFKRNADDLRRNP